MSKKHKIKKVKLKDFILKLLLGEIINIELFCISDDVKHNIFKDTRLSDLNTIPCFLCGKNAANDLYVIRLANVSNFRVFTSINEVLNTLNKNLNACQFSFNVNHNVELPPLFINELTKTAENYKVKEIENGVN